MASVDFPRAIAETGYMQNYYAESEYLRLMEAATKLSIDLK